MDGIVRESLFAAQWRQPRRLWIAAMMAVTLAGQLSAAEQPATRATTPRAGQPRPTGTGPSGPRVTASRAGDRPTARGPKVDHAVMPAGGMAAGQPRCSQCQRSACPQCRLAEAHHHGHAECQHGLCPANCPVRPDVFGFYGTRWRKWPGSGAVQASNNEAATPARPPRAEVPGVDEESLQPDAAAEDLPAPAADDMPDGAGKPEPTGNETGKASAEEGATAVQSQRHDVQEPGEDEEVSPTAWRTFTAVPPRIAFQIQR